MKRVITKKIGQMLVENNIITAKQLQEALERQKKRGGYIGQNLIELDYTTEEEIVSCLTVQYGYPYLPLKNYEINREIIKLIPKELAKDCYVIPIDKIGNVLTVTMANPLQEEAVRTIEKSTGCKVEIFVSAGSEIQHALKEYYGIQPDGKDAGQMVSEVNMRKDENNLNRDKR
jgi:type IV pilus assembly protein PilB